MVRITFDGSRERSSLKSKLLCMVMSVLLAVSFMPLHVFAETEAANNSGNSNDYGTEAYWEKYFERNTIKYYDDEIEKHKDESITLSENYTQGCGLGGIYFIKENHSIVAGETKSAFIVEGNVTLIFVKSGLLDIPKLEIKGGDAKGNIGAGAGILLKKGNSLFVKGVGKLDVAGGGAEFGEVGADGYDGMEDDETRPDRFSAGEGGDGGAGGGGAGAGIGTAGANGADTTKQEKRNGWDYTDMCWSYPQEGIASVNGTDSTNPSEESGVFKLAGDVVVKASGGRLEDSADKTISNAGNSPKGSHITGGNYYNCGGGGGGGNGGAGFPGAKIGSGGVGGAAGGTGGSGSYEYGFDDYYYSHGGGGGAGAGSAISYGGGNNVNCGKHKRVASEGGYSSDLKPGVGGRGARGDSSISGMTGGNGGSIKCESGGASAWYSVRSISPVGNDSSSDSTHDGKEARMFKAFPADECKVVFENAIRDGNVFKYTGEQIKPEIKVVHTPTNTVINENAYTVDYGSNKTPESGDKWNFVRVIANDFGEHDLLMDKTMSNTQAYIHMPIKIVYDLEISGISTSEIYNGQPIKPDLSQLKISKKVSGEDITEKIKPLLKFTFCDKSGVEVPDMINAGEYIIKVSYLSDLYELVEHECHFYILPRELTIIDPNIASREYEEGIKTFPTRGVEFGNVPSGQSMEPIKDYTWSAETTDGDCPGKHKVIYKVRLENKNYSFDEYAGQSEKRGVATGNIYKKTLKLEGLDIKDKIYDGTPVKLEGQLKITRDGEEITSSTGGKDISYNYYKVTKDGDEKITNIPKDIGKYKLIVSVENDLYTGMLEIDFNILPESQFLNVKKAKVIGEKLGLNFNQYGKLIKGERKIIG